MSVPLNLLILFSNSLLIAMFFYRTLHPKYSFFATAILFFGCLFLYKALMFPFLDPFLFNISSLAILILPVNILFKDPPQWKASCYLPYLYGLVSIEAVFYLSAIYILPQFPQWFFSSILCADPHSCLVWRLLFYFISIGFSIIFFRWFSRLSCPATSILIGLLPNLTFHFLILGWCLFLVVYPQSSVAFLGLVGIGLLFAFEILLYPIGIRQILHSLNLLDELQVFQKQGLLMYQYTQTKQQLKQLQLFQHDIANHLQTIGSLIDSQNYERAQAYFHQVSDFYKQIEPHFYCENPLVNALLSKKIDEMHQANIETTLDIQIPSFCPIKDLDLVSLFSNLLDNALESCQQVLPPLPRTLTLTVKPHQGYYVCKLMNSKPNCKSPFISKKHLYTTKTQEPFRHGLGTQILESVAKKYSGQIEFRDEGNYFISIIFLKIPS